VRSLHWSVQSVISFTKAESWERERTTWHTQAVRRYFLGYMIERASTTYNSWPWGFCSPTSWFVFTFVRTNRSEVFIEAACSTQSKCFWHLWLQWHMWTMTTHQGVGIILTHPVDTYKWVLLIEMSITLQNWLPEIDCMNINVGYVLTDTVKSAYIIYLEMH